MKISSLQVNNVKRIKAVNIDFAENGMTIIGGRNRQGKTSVLSALSYALAGERFRPSNFKREGSEADGYIRVTFDDGMVVERKGKNSSLTVIDSTGKKGGQALLDEFVSKLSIDLPKFINGTPSEKASLLLKIIGLEDQLDALDAEEKCLYDERTMVGRIAEQKEKACKELEFYPDVPEVEVSLDTLKQKLMALVQKNASVKAVASKLEENNARLVKMMQAGQNLETQKTALAEAVEKQKKALQQQIALLQESFVKQTEALDNRIAENNEAVNALATEVAEAEELVAGSEIADTSAVEAEIANCEEINAKVRANIARAEKLKEADAMKQEYDDLTEKVEDVRRRRKELLDGADLPYPGLSVQNGELLLNGKSWDCMSGAEQLIVACAIARRINDKCDFVLMDKMEQFDLESLNEFETWCEANNLQVIATRVSTGDECSIIIEDGYVVGQEQEATNENIVPVRKVKPTPVVVPNDGLPDVPVEAPVVAEVKEESDAMKAAKALLARKRAELRK